ncbi:hypothetical protein V8E51_012106 [Hyaloscypha variabilis]
MSFFFGNDEVLSDSEYESAASRSTPSPPNIAIENSDSQIQRSHLSPLDSPSLPMMSAGRDKTKKKQRRGTGVPASFLKFPRRRVDEDVEKIEDDVTQLLHLGETIKTEVEVSDHILISTAKTRRDHLLQELKRNTHLEEDSPLPKLSNSTSDASSSTQHHSLAEDLKHNPSLSTTLAFRPKQEPHNSNPENQLHSLQRSLTQIRTHLATLESAISDNITSQLITLTGSPNPVVADTFSLPSFRTKKQNQSLGAILGTVKVVCAVERGLEALCGVLEMIERGGEGEEVGEGEGKGMGDLMEACLESPEEVALEMQRAIVGMRRVLKSKVEQK